MRNYQPFIESLKNLIKEYPGTVTNPWKKLAVHSIDGLASEELRNRVSLEDRRASGAFFTDTELGSAVLKSYNLSFGEKVNFYDPACGASNLLISVKNHFSNKLSKKNLLLEVFGTDIHEEFIEVSQLRLKISDLLTNSASRDYSKKIVVADGLKPNKFYQNATHVVTNPPFNLIDSPVELDWASGKVSAAALFIDVISKNVNPGTEIIAILPDVLRSGSRYEKWRCYISTLCEVKGIKLFGQFDNYADVDVFSVLLTKKEHPFEEVISPWVKITVNESKLSDLFNVSVGTVVDNRDPHKGIERPYLISKGLEGWTELNQTELVRKHKGKMVQSPFVVIKRTSRFGDNHRAIATLVNIPEPVYVDNHLIVLQPKEGGIVACKKLMKILKTSSTDEWIDSQIRCRHLTVKVVSNIPF